jgi:DNA-directed RNA polymerase specialized sigma24 family protein
VYVFVLRRVRTHHDAEDLAQEVFVDAVEAELESENPPLLAWLYTVARRRLIDDLRRQARSGAHHFAVE